MRRKKQDPAAQLGRLTALLAAEVRHRLYARRPARMAGDGDRRESAIASEVMEEAFAFLLDDAHKPTPSIGAILATAIHLLERRIASRNRAKGDKPAANGGGVFT
jgi:hypothetical protein